jgi:hypothetical protein
MASLLPSRDGQTVGVTLCGRQLATMMILCTKGDEDSARGPSLFSAPCVEGSDEHGLTSAWCLPLAIRRRRPTTT